MCTWAFVYVCMCVCFFVCACVHLCAEWTVEKDVANLQGKYSSGSRHDARPTTYSTATFRHIQNQQQCHIYSTCGTNVWPVKCIFSHDWPTLVFCDPSRRIIMTDMSYMPPRMQWKYLKNDELQRGGNSQLFPICWGEWPESLQRPGSSELGPRQEWEKQDIPEGKKREEEKTGGSHKEVGWKKVLANMKTSIVCFEYI